MSSNYAGLIIGAIISAVVVSILVILGLGLLQGLRARIDCEKAIRVQSLEVYRAGLD